MQKSFKYTPTFLTTLLSGLVFSSLLPLPVQAETISSSTSNTNQSVQNQKLGTLVLRAKLDQNEPALENGVVWRIFSRNPKNNNFFLVTSVTGGHETFKLPVGDYMIAASYGYAKQIFPIHIQEQAIIDQNIDLNGGAVAFDAFFPQSKNSSAQTKKDLKFSLFFTNDDDDQTTPYVQNIKPNEVIFINQGDYRLVTYYGGQEAAQNNIQIKNNKLTQAKVELNNAQITLKLVNHPHGEALAGTQWSIIDASSDISYEKASAYINPVLFTGEYTVIASNNGMIYEKTLKVTAGHDQEIEIIADPKKGQATTVE